MGLIQVLVVQLDQFDALVLLQSGELFELLPEKVDAELHGRVLIEVVEVLHVLDVLLSVRAGVVVDVLDLLGHDATQRSGVVTSPRAKSLVVCSELVVFVLPNSHVHLLHVGLFDQLVHCGLIEDTRSWSKEHRANKAADASEHVDVASSSSIMEAQLVQPSLANHPRGTDRIDERGHDESIDYVSVDIGPFCQGS